MTDRNVDQTQFMTEEPFYEKQEIVVPPPKAEPATGSTPAKKSSRLVIIIASLSVFVLVIGVLLVAVMGRSKPTPVPTTEQPSETEKQTIGPFSARLDELQSQLQAADPTKEELPFPPIDMHIRLEQKKQ